MKEKKLFIIRHAKAEDYYSASNDFDRNTVEKGINRSIKLALQLKESKIFEEEVMFISSSANRAIQTAELFANILDYPKHKIVQNRDLYEASYKEILKEINKVPLNINTLFVFGHNPGLSDLVNYICNSYTTLNTSAIAEIDLEIGFNFDELSANTATLRKVYSE